MAVKWLCLCVCWSRLVTDVDMYFTAGDSRRRPSALHWDALSIFLENVMSRAVTSDNLTDATEAGVSLLKRLLLFTSTVSCHEHAAVITAGSFTTDTCLSVCVCACMSVTYVCVCFDTGGWAGGQFNKHLSVHTYTSGVRPRLTV